MAVEHTDSRDARIGRIVNEYLDRKQRGDAVSEESLLRAHPDLAEELRAHFGIVQQVISVSSPDSLNEKQVPALPPDFLPGYEILNEIHRGGQGVVYLALQKATRRQVAIKVTREGPFAGWRDRARFEREVHVLGALKHPSIVTIHESGVAAGCQYFVMDYISGSPLDIWLTRAPRTIEQTLRLFVIICDAINAAHIKGIIHRDLKPGNIRMDAEDQPHILDFGLAKVAAEPDMDKADMTAVGQFVGSLPWTSPEQAQGSLDQIDTRTDVYALGVILYQMLTATFPYEVVGPVRDVLNRIVGNEPARPSTIRKEIDKDVDAIVLRCLRKEPQRRYQTAGELGNDIERHLSGQPVAARGDSGLYILGKMLRRYRVPVVVAASFTILVAVSLFGSLSLWRRAATERDRAVAAEGEQDRQRSRAEQALAIAKDERASAQEKAEQLRRITYLNRIALAQNAYEQKYMTQAQHLLVACPADLREWEWYHLLKLSQPPTLLDIEADSKRAIALTLSPDGHRIVTGGYDGVIRIWDTQTRTRIAELKGHSGQVQALRWSPNGRWIASGGLDKTLRLWDVGDGTHQILEEGKEYVNAVAFSRDSTRLASGGLSKILTVREVPGGQIVARTPAHEGEILCVAYSPDGKHVATGESLNPVLYSTSKVRLWDPATGQGQPLVEHQASILSVAFNPDGSRIASGSSMPATGRNALGTLKISNSTTGEMILSLRGHEGSVDALAFSLDGKLLASAGAPSISALGMEADHTLKIWDAATGAERSTYSAHNGGGRAVAWTPDSSHVFSGGNDGRLKAWPSSVPSDARVLRGHSGAVFLIAFSPDGKRIASSGGRTGRDRPGASDEAIRIWDLKTGGPPLSLAGLKDAALSFAWSPDGKHIASGNADNTIHLWNSTTGSQEWSPITQSGTIQSVAFSPDRGASEFLAAAAGTTVTLWRIADAQEFHRLQHNETLVTAMFSPDGQSMGTCSVNGTIKIWDYRLGVEIRSISTEPGLSCAAFSADSKVIATGHSNGTIALWSVSTGEKLGAIARTPRAVQGLAFSPDGQRIASCSGEPLLRIWDVRSASEVYDLRAYDAPVTCVSFSPDGSSIATGDEEGLIKLSDAPIELTTHPSSTVEKH